MNERQMKRSNDDDDEREKELVVFNFNDNDDDDDEINHYVNQQEKKLNEKNKEK